MNFRHWKCAGPILLSALSLFITFFLLQPIALFLNPSFSLLASRGIGKVAFVSMVIYQILLFLSTQSKQFFADFLERVLFFFVREPGWFQKFARYFLIFFSLHAFILFFLYLTGFVLYDPTWGSLNVALFAKTLFGLFVVFMLAWTEELIFRGTIYPYFSQFYKPLPSMLITSTIFMLVHNLTNPLALVTSNWKLGLGLFLLGLFLNQIFVITKKLYTGMGVHAGLVFVKVVLRRAPFLVFIAQSEWPWWLHRDLRQAPLAHVLFSIAILFLFAKYRRSSLRRRSP